MNTFKRFNFLKYSNRFVTIVAFFVRQNKYAQNPPIINSGLNKLILMSISKIKYDQSSTEKKYESSNNLRIPLNGKHNLEVSQRRELVIVINKHRGKRQGSHDFQISAK